MRGTPTPPMRFLCRGGVHRGHKRPRKRAFLTPESIPSARARNPINVAKRKRTTRSRSSASAPSQRALAKSIGRSPGTIGGWVAHPEWPFGRRGPFNVEAVRQWAANTLTRDAGDVGADRTADVATDRASDHRDLTVLQRARVAKLVAEVELLRERLKRTQEKSVDREAAERVTGQMLAAISTLVMAESRGSNEVLHSEGIIADEHRDRAIEICERRMRTRLQTIVSRMNELYDQAVREQQ